MYLFRMYVTFVGVNQAAVIYVYCPTQHSNCILLARCQSCTSRREVAPDGTAYWERYRGQSTRL